MDMALDLALESARMKRHTCEKMRVRAWFLSSMELEVEEEEEEDRNLMEKT